MKEEQTLYKNFKHKTKEEIANSITHGMGVLASIIGLILLIIKANQSNNRWMIASFSIYGSSMIILFLASTLYHALPHPRVKRVFQVIDHSSIYILIAGTYTPFTLVSLRGGWGWSLFGTVWGLAIVGIILDVFYHGSSSKLETISYVLMGWLSIIAIHRLFAVIGLNGILLLIGGGAVYTLGVIFYRSKKIPFNHAIWHLFVLGGGICHFLVVFFFVVPS